VIDWYIKEPQEKKEILTQILGIWVFEKLQALSLG
jgi:hypothetical protein